MGHLGNMKEEYRDLLSRLDAGAVAFPEPEAPAPAAEEAPAPNKKAKAKQAASISLGKLSLLMMLGALAVLTLLSGRMYCKQLSC